MFWDFFLKIDLKNIYLWLCWVFAAACRLSLVADSEGLLTSCVATVSHCGGFSCCRTWALGHTAFSSGSAWAVVPKFQSRGLVVVAHGPSCFIACGSFPDQGLKLSPSLTGRFFTTEPPGSPQLIFYRRISINKCRKNTGN